VYIPSALLTRRAFAAYAFVAILSSCATVGTSIDDRLYFGRNIPGGGAVTDADWNAFLAEVVTPAFPQGFTTWRTQGQWRNQSGTIEREDGFVIQVTHPDDPKADAAIRAIADAYKTRFKQEAVMHIRDRVESRFY
jgi:hypothetical protein